MQFFVCSQEHLLWLFGIERLIPPETVYEKRAQSMAKRIQLQKADSEALPQASKTLGTKPDSFILCQQATKQIISIFGYDTPCLP